MCRIFRRGVKRWATALRYQHLAGKREIMELGGLYHDKQRVFLLSTTHGAETHAMAAAIATIKFYKENNVIERLYEQGQKLEDGVMKASRDLNLQDKVAILGPPCCSVYTSRDQNNQPSQPFRTLFIQETMKRGSINAFQYRILLSFGC